MAEMKPLPFAGFSPPQANYYRLPNQWFDIWAQVRALLESQGARLSRSDGLLKLLEYLIKYTWGYLNFDDPVRLTFDEFTCGRRRALSGGDRGERMDQGTGLSSASIKKNMDRLLALGLIQKIEDNSDKARVRCWYAPRLTAEHNPEAESGQMDLSRFAGFDRPNTNYFPVPFEWTNLTREIGSAVAILCVEYLMRHTFGWQDEIRWLTPVEIASGRRKRDGSTYDNGIQYSRDAVASACDTLVGQGILVRRSVRRDAGRESKKYTLRMQERGSGRNENCDTGLEDNAPSTAQPDPGGPNETLAGKSEVSDQQTKALTRQSKPRSGINTPEQNRLQHKVTQPTPTPRPASPADADGGSISLAPKKPEDPPPEDHVTRAKAPFRRQSVSSHQAESGQPSGPSGSAHGQLTRTQALECLDKLSIFEPTRSRLARLRWIADAGYLQTWAAWYWDQSDCGVSWVIRQIETGIQAPHGNEKHRSDWDGLQPGQRAVESNIRADFQEERCGRQKERCDGSQDPAVQPWQELWDRALGELRSQMTRAAFDSWLAASRPLARHDDMLTVGVRNQYAQEWLDIRFRPLVTRALAGIDPTISQVQFVVWDGEKSMSGV